VTDRNIYLPAELQWKSPRDLTVYFNASRKFSIKIWSSVRHNLAITCKKQAMSHMSSY